MTKMLARLRPRLNFANVVSVLALFIALGGGAYAAIKLPKNSVGNKQLKKNAVTSTKVKDHSLLSKDFKSGQLPNGAQGPAGLKGDQGAQGDIGPSDIYASGSGAGAISADAQNQTEVGSLDLPPGSYLLGAKLLVSSPGVAAEVDCAIRPAASTTPQYDIGVVTTPSAGSGADYGILSLAGAVTLTSEEVLHVTCWNNQNSVNGTADYGDARFWAIRTGNLHATLPLPLD